MRSLTRREFSAAAGAALAGASAAARAQGKALTAGEVVDRVKAHLGIPWNTASYRDTFKIGNPDMPVKGIASTFGTNFRVMQLAQKAGLNMIVTHEPTFWSDADTLALVQNDALYRLKRDFGDRNGMVVWRIHDHWHARKPDGIRTGWNKAMGWDAYKVNGDLSTFDIPPTTLGELARYVAKTLNTQSARIIGDPNLPVRRVGRGGHPLDANMAAMPNVDCIIVSEAREYDSFEYARDYIRMGAKKGAIFISHQSGEDEGMREFASWSSAFIPEVPIRFIPTTDEFWTV
jgi:putative NIF3 family GTP cyclohydrolase 1 type 2